jgi:hypothetical protein
MMRRGVTILISHVILGPGVRNGSCLLLELISDDASTMVMQQLGQKRYKFRIRANSNELLRQSLFTTIKS